MRLKKSCTLKSISYNLISRLPLLQGSNAFNCKRTTRLKCKLNLKINQKNCIWNSFMSHDTLFFLMTCCKWVFLYLIKLSWVSVQIVPPTNCISSDRHTDFLGWYYLLYVKLNAKIHILHMSLILCKKDEERGIAAVMISIWVVAHYRFPLFSTNI